MNLINKSVVARNIYDSRLLYKINRSELALIVGVTTKSVYNWETGKTFPKLINILSLCNYFDRKVDEFLGIKIAPVL